MTNVQAREYPRTFAHFEGKSKNGLAPRKYWIQDAPEEFFDEIVEYLSVDFPKDEPISKYKKGYTDKVTEAEVRGFQREMLQQKISLACLTKDERGDTKLAGFNVFMITNKEEEEEDFKSDGWFLQFMVGIFDYIDSKRSIYEAFGVDKCLKAVGLFVLPEYRGEGLAVQILKARMPLCKSLGIKVTSTIFTSALSQRAAYKAGYKDFYAIDYEELFKEKPEFYIPNIQEHTKTIKVLYHLVD